MSRPYPTLRGLAATLAAAAAVLGLAACETPLDRAYGLSQREHKAQSIVDPDAGIENLEAARPDGRTTDSALFKYRRLEATSEEQGAAPSVINVDIGG